MVTDSMIKSQLTASARLHRQTPLIDNDSSLLLAAVNKAEPLISKAAVRVVTDGQMYRHTDRRKD